MRGNFTLNVNFNLRQTEPANKATPINAIVRFNNERIVISGIDKVEPRYWNSDKQCPKQHAANPRAREISRSLSDARLIIEETFNTFIEEHGAYPDELKAFQAKCRCKVLGLPDNAERTVSKRSNSFAEYLEQLIQDIRANKKVISSGKSKGLPYSKNSIKTYTNLLFNLSAFKKHTGRNDINFTDIDLDFYTDFRSYLVTHRNLSPGYFGDMVKAIKSVMADSFDRGYHTNLKHKSRHFIKESAEADTVFLDTERLDKLLDMDLSKKPYLDKARNLFLIGCYSGLRFSDYCNIKPENISEDFLRIRAQKTKEYISIPISRQLRTVLNRYPDLEIKPISNQKLNEYIKDVCEEAGFNEDVSVKRFERGKEVFVKVPFYKLVSSHTARRSFCTNAFKGGYPTILIRAISGHKTESAFLKYIRLDNEDKSVMMLKMMRRNELKVVNGGDE